MTNSLWGFLPEFIEAQRISFLNLIKIGIAQELEKHNPIELNFKKSQNENNHFVLNKKNKTKLELDSQVTLFKSPRIRYQKQAEDDLSRLQKLTNYLIPDNYLTNPNDYRKEHFVGNGNGNEMTQNWALVSKTSLPSFTLKNEFRKLETKTQKWSIFFHSNEYKLLTPKETIQSCILKSKTYSAPIYIPVQLKTSSNQQILFQWVLLGNLPLMTNRGHFIINGTARVILHQLVRSPGVYFAKSKNNITHYADIICHRGVWIRIEMTKKGILWLRMKNFPKIPILLFLQSFGCEYPHFLSQLKNQAFLSFSDKLKSEIRGKKLPVSARYQSESKLSEITRHVFRYSRQARLGLNFIVGETTQGNNQKISSTDFNQAINILRQKFSSKNYDLSQVGRLQFNRKLGLNKPITYGILTFDDFICIINYLLNVQNGVFEIDDIDDLKNRRVRCSGELILNQIGIGLMNVERLTRKKEHKLTEFLSNKKLNKILNFQPVNGILKEFFNSSQLSQFLDQTNCLAEITHKRRLSSLGPGGITRETAGMKIRSIHPSHYGRICPIETPEGPNAGLVNSLTTYARINLSGFLETPFYKVKNGQLQNKTQVFYVSANQDNSSSIAPADIKQTNLGFLKGNFVPVRIGNEFSRTHKKNIHFMSVSRIQMISIATSLIPFLEHDDANRALMGSNMQRQSVPLMNPTRPIVGTGLEGRVISDSGNTIQAKESGLVTYVSNQKIQILSFLKNKKISKKISFEINKITYFLNQLSRSNQNTAVKDRPLVKQGDWVEKGTCLVDCTSSAYGELSIGQNILIGYLPWEGYNFEDAILVSERLIFDDLFTSLHIITYKTEIQETIYGVEKITNERINDQSDTELSNLDSNGIIQLGTWVTEGDILVRKVTPIGKQKLDSYQKFLYVLLDKKMPTVKDTSLRVPKGLEGRIIDIQVRRSSQRIDLTQKHVVANETPIAVWISIAEKKWLQVGDKMAGRHGNKGIVSQILPRQDMPYLPDGTPLDMVLNPLGVPSRMNVGQIFESLLGLAGKNLNQNYKILPFDEISGPEASRSLTFAKLYQAKKKTGKDWLFQPNNPGKMRIFDGRTGEAFDQPVTVGIAYMLKLIHLVDEKLHARSTGPYSLVTQQPLRGRSKHGGQRFGEMEVWALEGFGAAYILQEILTIKSDDIFGRKHIVNYLLKDERIQIGRPESFRVLIRELQALCLSVNIFDYPIKDLTGYRRKPIDLNSNKFNQY